MRAETKPRRDEDAIIRTEGEVLELAREVLGRYSERLDDCPAPFFRAGLTHENDVTQNDERN